MANESRGAELSFSKVVSVEFCSNRYLLEYVQRKKLRPLPDYFVNGQAFHETAARMYRGLSRGKPPDEADLLGFLARRVEQPTVELQNAVRLAAQNAYEGWEIVGVEEPFVLSLGRTLPPCLGIADLILRRGSAVAVVDHKTGKRFNDPDELQFVLYREEATSCFQRPELNQARDLQYKVAMTEWNWNGGWGPAIRDQVGLDSLFARGLGVAGILHAIMRQGDVVELATQSMLIGDGWKIHAVWCDRTGKMPPFMLPSGQVSVLYSQHHGSERLPPD